MDTDYDSAGWEFNRSGAVANVSGGLRAGSGEIDTIAIRYYTGSHVNGQTQT